MNNVITRFKAGLYMATQSFNMVWYQKQLLLYVAIPAVFSFILNTIFYSTLASSNFIEIMVSTMAPVPLVVKIPLVVIIFYIRTLIATFFTAALIYHVTYMINDEQKTIQESLQACRSKIGLIALWALSIVIIEQVIPINIVVALPCIIWALYTFFVLRNIALEQRTLKEHIKHSCQVVHSSLVEILGGLSWFGIVVLLIYVPFYVLKTMLDVTFIHYTLLIVCEIFVWDIIINWWLGTALALFKVILYQEQEKKGL